MSESEKSSGSIRSRSSSTSSSSSSNDNEHIAVTAASRKQSEGSEVESTAAERIIKPTDKTKTNSRELENTEQYATVEEEKQMLQDKSAASFASKHNSRTISAISITGAGRTSSNSSATSLSNVEASSRTSVSSSENQRTITKNSGAGEQNSSKNSALFEGKRTSQPKNVARFESKRSLRTNSISSAAGGGKTALNDSATSLSNIKASSKSSISSRRSQRTPTKNSESEPSSSRKNSATSRKSSTSSHEHQRASTRNLELVRRPADAADNTRVEQSMKTEEIEKNVDTLPDSPAFVKKETNESESSSSEESDKEENTKQDAESRHSEEVAKNALGDRSQNNEANNLQDVRATDDAQGSSESNALTKTTFADSSQEMAAPKRPLSQRSTSSKRSLESIQKVRDSSSLSGGSKRSSIAGSRASSVTSNERKSSFPTLISQPAAHKTEALLEHKVSNATDSATKLPSLVSEHEEKQDITIEAVEKLLLGSEKPNINLPQEQQVLAAKSYSRPGSASSTNSSLSSSSEASSKSSLSPPNVDHENDDRSQIPPPTVPGLRISSRASDSSSKSGIGELSSMQFGRLRSKRTRPKTPNSLKEYARNASREGTAAAMLKASRRSTMDGSIFSVGSKSRIAASDAGNLAGDAFMDDSDQDQVVLTRRLSATVRQVLLGQHLPDHLKARHLAGIFVTGVVSKLEKAFTSFIRTQ